MHAEPAPPRVVIGELHIDIIREAPRPAPTRTPTPQRREPAREPTQRTAPSRSRSRLAFGLRQL